MTSQPRYFWEDFGVGSVREFGAHTLGRDEIVRFASEFDPQPFHLDEEAGRQSLFGGLAAWRPVAGTPARW